VDLLFVGDPIDAAILNRSFAGPGLKYGADRLGQLTLRILRELVEALEGINQLPERFDREVRVAPGPVLLSQLGDRSLELLTADSCTTLPNICTRRR
jgi:hypothetical protein